MFIVYCVFSIAMLQQCRHQPITLTNTCIHIYICMYNSNTVFSYACSHSPIQFPILVISSPRSKYQFKLRTQQRKRVPQPTLKGILGLARCKRDIIAPEDAACDAADFHEG
ncbi:hypothetical protein BD289DRAFT_440467 [Coniella lustricola]|uniref:Uncharacterized protein n=1 Tax=Coniella lustricola TaxID=2025994 RepID=A0A2T3A0J6_9PEZI|nr:hypothetical protein BD289DRAFT_440467 [Coniella lustricola]